MDLLSFRIRNFAFIANGSIVVVNNLQLTEEQLNLLEELINTRTNLDASYQQSESDTESHSQPDSLYESLVKRIRDGDNLTIHPLFSNYLVKSPIVFL